MDGSGSTAIGISGNEPFQVLPCDVKCYYELAMAGITPNVPRYPLLHSTFVDETISEETSQCKFGQESPIPFLRNDIDEMVFVEEEEYLSIEIPEGKSVMVQTEETGLTRRGMAALGCCLMILIPCFFIFLNM